MFQNTKPSRNLAKMLLVAVLFLATSCHLNDNEMELNKLQVKTAKLEYLERLYKLREDIEYKEKIRVLDSFIKKEKVSLDSIE